MSVDCDDAMLLIAARGQRTLTAGEESHLHAHLATCDECSAVTTETDSATSDDWRWVARIPDDAFEDPHLLVLPVVDPIVFTAGKVIARGGMGRITRAIDRRLGREVALKESLEGGFKTRFEREAAITARLQHPAIVPIYEAGTWPDGSLFYTMRLVDGVDLAKAIGKTSSLAERIALLPHVVRVTEALAYAHARGIIHRDLKPANVLVGAFGETVVIDWGIAKQIGSKVDDAKLGVSASLDPENNLTRVGTILGTPCFMSPEQTKGGVLDERADVYALGALLYNVLAETPPYLDRFDTAEKIMEQSLLVEPTPIRELAADAPADLLAIVEKAMARAPADRYRNAGEMADELKRFEAGQLIARAYTLRELAVRWLSKHRTAVIVTAIAATLLAVFAVVAVINVRQSRDAEIAARKDAESNLETARVNAAAALEEQARNEMLVGDRARGLAYASAAYSMGRDTPALRYLLATASRGVIDHVSEIGPPDLTTGCGTDPHCAASDTEALGYDNSGNLVMIETSGRVSTWRGGKRLRFFELGKEADTGQLDPTAARAAVVIGDSTLGVWEVATGKLLWSVVDRKLDGATATLTIDPTGKWLVAAGEHRAVSLRDLVTGADVGGLSVGGAKIEASAFSADGARIALAGKDGEVRVWNTADLQLVAAWKADPEPQRLVFAGPDRIVIDSAVGTAHDILVWAFDGGVARRIRALVQHAGGDVTLAATADGRLIATSDKAVLRLFDPEGELLADTRLARSRFETLRFVDTALIAQAILDHRLFVLERATLAPRALVDAHDGPVNLLALGPGTRMVSAGLHDQRVHEWELPGSAQLASVAGASAAFAGDRWIVASPAGLAFHRADTGAPDGSLAIELGDLPRLEVAGGRVLATGSKGKFVLDPAGKPIALAEPMELKLAHDGRHALAIEDRSERERDHDEIRVWDTATGKVVRSIKLKRLYSAAIAGDRVVVSDYNRIAVYEIPTGKLIANVQLPGQRVLHDLYVAPSGKTVIAASETKQLIVLDPATGNEVSRITTKNDVSEIRLSRDGQLVIAKSETGVWLWDATTGTLLSRVDRTADDHALSADGHRVATTHDGHVRLWDRASGRQLDDIHLVRDGIEQVAFDDTGSRLLIATKTTAVLIDVHLETRDAAAIEALAKRTGWKIEQGIAVPK